MVRRLAALFELDLRSLGLLRIGLGAVLLVDLATRAMHLRAHYTDAGVLPREALSVYGPRAELMLHAWVSASPVAVAGLFAVAAAAALALLVGWRTRAATLVSWLLLTSLQWRNPGLNYGGDVMLRMLLFWGLFLPLDARFSLAPRRGRGPPPADAYVSWASAAFLLQLCLVYWMTGLHRAGSGPEWWDGTALWYVLHYDQFATGFGVWLRDFEAILPPLSHAAFWFENLAPFLVFAPVATGPVRTAVVAAFLGFHVGLGALVHLGLFPVIFMIAWVGCLPGWLWERLPGGARVPERDGAPVRLPVAARAAAALALVWVVLCNLDGLDGAVGRSLPAGWDAPARLLSLDQRWALIAPPPRYDGWYVGEGHLADGSRVDPFHAEGEPRWDKPERVSAVFDFRWFHYLLDLELRVEDPRWGLLGRYLCEEWNGRHAGARRLVRMNLYYVRETTLPSGPERGEILLLHTSECPEPTRGPARPDSA